MLLREWAALKYPGYWLREQVRLGPTQSSLVNVQVSPALEAALRVWNWYADGVLVAPGEVLVIEAKVQPTPAAVGQVLFYLELMASTPELTASLSLPFVPMVLFAESDSRVTRFAQAKGVRVEIYTPAWIADYLTQVQFRRRSTAVPGANLQTESV